MFHVQPFVSFICASRVSFFVFFFFSFLIDNWPRVSRSHFHALTAFSLSLSFDLFYNMLSRSRTRKKRRRGAAYGKGLYTK